jgi:hypothetical protein
MRSVIHNLNFGVSDDPAGSIADYAGDGSSAGGLPQCGKICNEREQTNESKMSAKYCNLHAISFGASSC